MKFGIIGLVALQVIIVTNGQFSENDIPELKYLDTSVDPCDDFYEFTCGNFKNQHPVPPLNGTIDNFSILENELLEIGNEILTIPSQPGDPIALKKIKMAYASCLNTKLADQILAPELEIIKEFGTLPIIDPTDNTPLTFAQLGRIIGQTGIPLFIRPSVNQFDRTHFMILIEKDDVKAPNDTQRHIVPILGKSYDEIVLESFETIKSRHKSNRIGSKDAYDPLKELFISIANNLVRNGAKWARSDREIEKDVEDVIEVLAKSDGISDGSDVPDLGMVLTIQGLQHWTDGLFPGENFNWMEYFSEIFQPAGIDADPSIELYFPVPSSTASKHLYNVLNLIRRTDPKVFKNFVFMRTFLFLAPDSDKPTRRAFDKYLKALNFPVSDRQHYCTKKMLEIGSESMGFSFPAVYQLQQYHFNKNKIPAAHNLLNKLTDSFVEAVNNANWMDTESKPKALSKMSAMRLLLGWPDFVDDGTALSAFYENVRICEWDHFGNAKTIRAYQRAYSQMIYQTKQGLTHWTISSFTVNAFYNINNNRITLPISMLYDFFFDSSNPIIDFARIGTIISHEITHGFDNKGRQYDANGKYIDDGMWSNETLNQYKEKTHCFIDQYNAYQVPEVGRNISGELTINENIADNGGLKDAFNAFDKYIKEEGVFSVSEKYSLEQLFFISYSTMWCSNDSKEYLNKLVLTNAHPPSKYRVRGVLSNSEKFAKAFNCPLGSRMNPEEKCSLW